MSNQTVSVKLSAEVVYVAGTVNGVDIPWQRAQDGSWQAVVERSTDGLYDVQLVCYDELGQSTQFFTVLSFGFPYLITDRTQADVTYESFKGKYDCEDLNRVGAAMTWLKTELEKFGYFAGIDPKTDWTGEDYIYTEDCNKYLRELRVLQNILDRSYSAVVLPEDLRFLTWQEANHIEQLLVDLYVTLQRIGKLWFYSGELYSGEVIQ